jgi:hypothetical protein
MSLQMLLIQADEMISSNCDAKTKHQKRYLEQEPMHENCSAEKPGYFNVHTLVRNAEKDVCSCLLWSQFSKLHIIACVSKEFFLHFYSCFLLSLLLYSEAW